MMRKALVLICSLGGVVGSTHAEERQLKRVPFNAQDVLVINVGPLQGTMIMATPLKSLETGAVIGECQTLIYGYKTSLEEVRGFSCYKK